MAMNALKPDTGGGGELRAHDGSRRPRPNAAARPADRTAPPMTAVVDRHRAKAGLGWIAVVTVVLVGLVAGMLFLPPEAARWLTLTALPLLAMVGIAAIFAVALGMLIVPNRAHGDLLTRTLADSAPEGLLVTEPDGRIVYANRAYADMTGVVSARDVRSLERVLADLPDANEAVYQMTRALAAGRAETAEIRVPPSAPCELAGHATRWLRISARPVSLPDGDGSKLVLWAIVDITPERTRQEAAFQSLQEAIDHLDQAPLGFMTVGGDGTLAYLNATLARWAGLDLSEFRPGTVSEAMILGGADDVAVINDRPLRIHSSRPDPDGTRRIALVPVDGEGAALPKGSDDRLARLVHESPFGIATLDADGVAMQSNPAIGTIFKTEHFELGAIDGWQGAERLRDSFATMLEKGVDGQPVELVCEEGERTVQAQLLVARDIDDGAQAVLHAIDVTERRALERRMEQGQKMEAVGVLAGGVAHDFNNVLTAVVGHADELLDSHTASDPSWPNIVGIKQSANRAASLVRQLLAFSRRQTLRPEYLSITDALSDLSLMLRKLAGDRVELEWRHGRDLWAVKADLGQIEQVIVNLVVNARDAIHSARDTGGMVRIATENIDKAGVEERFAFPGLVAQDYVKLSVSDNGTGMSEEVLQSIFEPFFTTKEIGKGTGLGLSMVYGIVKQSGGFIYPESTEGEGTTFHLFLPRYEPREGEEPVNAPVTTKKARARDLSGDATILFAEDEDAVRSIFVHALQKRGYTVHAAEDGEEALEIAEDMLARGERIDLVVSDVVMPLMDGPTLFRKIKELTPDVPFIFASGHAEDAFEANLPDAKEQSFEFMTKPYNVKMLLEKVKDATAG